MKWSFMPKEVGERPHYLVVNADEGEPGTCKDREILRHEPQKLIEGCLLACAAMGAHTAYVYVRASSIERLRHCSGQSTKAYAAGMIGENACDSGWRFDMLVHRGAEPTSAAKKRR